MKNKTETPMLPPRREHTPRTYPVLSAQKIAEIIESKCGNVRVAESHGKGRNKVFFLPEAYQEYKMIVSHGRRSPMNHNEKKFIGLGHFLMGEENTVNIVVAHFIEVLTTNRSTVSASCLGPNGEASPGLDFLEYHREEFLRHEKQYNQDACGCMVDPFLKLCGSSECVLDGHTHPNLGVFFSGPDKANGAARAASAPVCIFVCDPVRSEMLGCVGREFDSAEIIAYDRTTQTAARPEEHEENRTRDYISELMHFADGCLRIPGITGTVKSRTRMDGKVRLKIDLVVPKLRRRGKK